MTSRTKLSHYLALALGLAVISPLAHADRVYVTYVQDTQKERESTRFTLTEWLRIKERMRMMDLWLALFSDPAKDRFSPEVGLAYGFSQGALAYAGLTGSRAGEADLLGEVTTEGEWGRLDLFLTNLISSTTKIRTLNIDLGGEAAFHSIRVRRLGDEVEATASRAGVSADALRSRKNNLRYYAVDARIFGRSIQDSSLVLRYGKYQLDTSMAGNSILAPVAKYEGPMAGATLQAYLFAWLGLEGNYNVFQPATAGTATIEGRELSYGAFIEVSLIRLSATMYDQKWDYTGTNGDVSPSLSGITYGAKLQF